MSADVTGLDCTRDCTAISTRRSSPPTLAQPLRAPPACTSASASPPRSPRPASLHSTGREATHVRRRRGIAALRKALLAPKAELLVLLLPLRCWAGRTSLAALSVGLGPVFDIDVFEEVVVRCFVHEACVLAFAF